MTKQAFLRFDIAPEDKAKFVQAAKARNQKLVEWVMDALLDEHANMIINGEIPRATKKNRVFNRPN